MTMMIMSQVTRRNRRKEKSERHEARKNHRRKIKRRSERRMTQTTRMNRHNTIRTIILVRRVAARRRIVKSVHQKDMHKLRKSLNNNKVTLHQWRKFVSNLT
jgi:hypothetical protein